MAQFIKVLTGSKLLLLPFTAVGVLGVGSFYATYNASRWASAKVLGVDHNNTSTVSPPASTAFAAALSGQPRVSSAHCTCVSLALPLCRRARRCPPP